MKSDFQVDFTIVDFTIVDFTIVSLLLSEGTEHGLRCHFASQSLQWQRCEVQQYLLEATTSIRLAVFSLNGRGCTFYSQTWPNPFSDHDAL